LQRVATIAGEVRYPGKYSLLTTEEKISDLISRAGGVSSDAYPNGVIFYRPRNAIGRIGIDLPAVLRNPRSPDNLTLQDGDSLYIPRYNAVVLVQGSVNTPIAVTYNKGNSLDDYIRAAGGPTVGADVTRAYVRQPNGKVQARQHKFLLPDVNPRPEPGSVVVVPPRSPLDKPLDILQATGLIAQISGALITLIIAVRR
jgi:protein involved in polysaccharide export with SLBB domain